MKKQFLLSMLIGTIIVGAYFLASNEEVVEEYNNEQILEHNDTTKNIVVQEEKNQRNDEEDTLLESLVDEDEEIKLEDLEGNGGYSIDREVETTWKYELIPDQMKGALYIISNNSLNEEVVSHYGDKSDLKIILRDRQLENDKDVIFKLQHAFFCEPFKSCKIKVKIDDYYFETDVNLGAQNRHDLLFVKSRGYFLDMLKKSNHMVVEVPLNGIGYKAFTFNTGGLELE